MLVGAPGLSSVRATLIAVPGEAETLASAGVLRLLATADPVPVDERAEATLRFDGLPTLSAYLVVWDGAADRPCPGTIGVAERVSFGRDAPVRLPVDTAWQGPCLSPPRSLLPSDRVYFAPASRRD